MAYEAMSSTDNLSVYPLIYVVALKLKSNQNSLV